MEVGVEIEGQCAILRTQIGSRGRESFGMKTFSRLGGASVFFKIGNAI
jgi:hypothetical protein